MSKVEKMNPPSESRVAGNGSILTGTMLRHLAAQGLSMEVLEKTCPVWGDEVTLLCELYGEKIYLSGSGRISIEHKPIGSRMEEVVEVVDESCEHGFVVREILGDNHFLCRECNERFPRHPSVMENERFRPDDAEVFDSLAQFRDGMKTYSEVCKQTSLSLEEFVETVQRIFPPDEEYVDQYEIGKKDPIGKEFVRFGPQRTSCPEKVEDIIGCPEITLTDLNEIIRNTFPDIVEIEHLNCKATKEMIIYVTFVDGSTQKIVMNEMKLIMDGNKMLRTFPGTRHMTKPFEEDRKSWNLTPFQLELLRTKPLTRSDRWE